MQYAKNYKKKKNGNCIVICNNIQIFFKKIYVLFLLETYTYASNIHPYLFA